METNKNFSNKEKYFSEEYLLKYINGELSPEESEELNFFIQNDNAIADIYEGLTVLKNPKDIIEEKETLNEKIDVFSKNKLKNILYKYRVIRKILLILLIAVTVAAIIIFINFKINTRIEQAQFDENNNLISERYNKILFLSDNKQFVKEVVINEQKEIHFTKYFLEENIKFSEIGADKKLLKISDSEKDHYISCDSVYCSNNKIISANYSEGDDKYFSEIKIELQKINNLKAFVAILNISDSGELTNVQIVNNFNKDDKEIKKIFLNKKKWNPSKKEGMFITSKIAIVVEK